MSKPRITKTEQAAIDRVGRWLETTYAFVSVSDKRNVRQLLGIIAKLRKFIEDDLHEVGA